MTPEEMSRTIIGHLRMMADYWAHAKIHPRSAAEDGGEVQARLSGLVHSILVMFDGGASGIPALDIVARPHPDDEAFRRSEGEDDYWPDGAVINSVNMHDMWYRK
mgnify:FL=1